MPSLKMPRLSQRGGVYHYRMAVPRNLVGRFGYRDIKGSLKTRDPITARIRCRNLSNCFDELITQVKTMPGLSTDKINELVRSYFEDRLATASELAHLAAYDEKFDKDAELEGLESEQAKLKRSLAKHVYDADTKSTAIELVSMAGLKPPAPASEEFHALCHGVLRAELERHRMLAHMLLGNYSDLAAGDPLFTGISPGKLPAIPGDPTAPAGPEWSVGALVKAYVAYKQASKAWTPKTTNENQRVLDWFVELVGPAVPIKQLSSDPIREFRDALMKLPANFTKAKALKGKTFKQIVASANGPGTLATQTSLKYFSAVKGFLNWCEEENYLEKSPGGKIKISTSGAGSPQEARYPYSKEQLQQLFKSPQYTGHKSQTSRNRPGTLIVKDGKYWIPLVALFTGMRLGEIVQPPDATHTSHSANVTGYIPTAKGLVTRTRWTGFSSSDSFDPIMNSPGGIAIISGQSVQSRNVWFREITL